MGELLKTILMRNAQLDNIISATRLTALAARTVNPDLVPLYDELIKKFEEQKKCNADIAILVNQIGALTRKFAEENGIDFDQIKSDFMGDE